MEDPVYDLYAELEDFHWWFEGRRQIIFPLIKKRMSEFPDRMIVDVGCGTGGNIASLARDYNCVGLDFSEKAIDYAKKKYPHCDFLQGTMPVSLERLAPNVGVFLLMDVLEHIPDDKRFFDDLVKITLPGSYIIITVPANPALWSRHDEMSGHHRRYEKDTLEALFKKAPVDVQFMTYFNSRLYPLVWIIRKIGQIFKKTTGDDDTDLSRLPGPINALLTALFGSEASVVSSLDDGKRTQGFKTGVSLICLLKRIPDEN